MRYPVQAPIDAEFEVRATHPSKATVRAALNRLAFATVAVVVICIFAVICAGAALAAAFLTANQ